MIEVKAQLKYLRIAPRKVRLVADLIRRRSLKEAKAQLSFSTKAAASPFLKLLKSAESSARHDFKLNPENLYLKSARVDTGPILKRFRARARGRASMIRHRTSHVTLVLQEQEKHEARNPKHETISKSK